MPERTMREAVKPLEHHDVAISMVSGERLRGRIEEVGEDYLIIHREHMLPTIVHFRNIETIG